MAYDYGARIAWIDDLHDTAMPHAYDLCPAHADRMSVPVGWELRDRRVSAVRLLFAAAG
jgi:hypothetical protein